jgi:hypothetical protein
MRNSFATLLRAVSPGGRSVSGVVLVSLLCCTLTAFVVRAYHNSGSPKESAVQPLRSPSTLGSTAQQSGSIEAEVITIRPTGFEPQEITRPKGLFLLAVENRSGLQTIQLRLDREAGARLRDLQMSRNKHDWKDMFDLPPGRYILSEAYHPQWSCSFTITAK